ncbi:MAG: hypothetical protein JWR06_1304, partial [Jatrophihabitans sp.]|nr:hypothetical protein [Jatrophihabitans sp.]
MVTELAEIGENGPVTSPDAPDGGTTIFAVDPDGSVESLTAPASVEADAAPDAARD